MLKLMTRLMAIVGISIISAYYPLAFAKTASISTATPMPVPMPINAPAESSYPLPPNVNTVVVNGNINLELKQAKKGEVNHFEIVIGMVPLKVSLQGNAVLFKALPLKSSKKPRNIPFILLPPQPVTVIVSLSQLNTLFVNDTSSVFARRLNAPNLQVIANTCGKIDLSGTIGLQTLINRGPGMISIHQIKVQELHIINAGNASLDLGGHVRYLQVRLGGNSRLDATHVGADIAFVQTRDQAQARVNVTERLYAFATDQSMILYYSDPAAKVEYSSESGNVLKLN